MPDAVTGLPPARRRVTVVAPVYNEQEVIAAFYDRTREVLDTVRDRYASRILFVVDRCTDDTLTVLRGIAARDRDVQVLALSSRFGHQMSLLAGIDHAADADAVIMMDSDLQHPPELIPELLERFERGSDVVFTVRRDSVEIGRVRRLLGNGFYRVMGYLSNIPVQRNTADFRLISGRVARTLRDQLRERGVFLRGILSWVGFNQEAVEYTPGHRAAGRSKYSFSRMMALATAGILSFSTKPLRMGIFVGLGFALLGFAYGAVTVVSYFADPQTPRGYATIVTLLLLFSGVQLVFMGILGAYVGAIYDEVKRRPHYIVDEAINFGADVRVD
ncbi:MAG: glycosyltransferase family 2 protein [Gemmatimonadales bacterium]